MNNCYNNFVSHHDRLQNELHYRYVLQWIAGWSASSSHPQSSADQWNALFMPSQCFHLSVMISCCAPWNGDNVNATWHSINHPCQSHPERTVCQPLFLALNRGLTLKLFTVCLLFPRILCTNPRGPNKSVEIRNSCVHLSQPSLKSSHVSVLQDSTSHITKQLKVSGT